MGMNCDRQPVNGKPHIVPMMLGWRCSDPKAGILAYEGIGPTPTKAFNEWDAARSFRDYKLLA